jgi:single-stranded-DNA-specific exonuclease
LSQLRWREPEPLPPDAPALHSDPLINELLVRRGHTDPEEVAAFLRPHRRPAPDLSRMPNLHHAAERICTALETSERIAIFGDYDADGITSTALLTRALRAAAREPDSILVRLPTRDEGYGLNRAAVDDFANAGARLLIAVDCASSDHANVEYAQASGLEVVILDHHHMTDAGPRGAIVVSAQLNEDGTYRELAAVGVAYLLVAALAQHGCQIDGQGEPETTLLDYVALGTIADVSPLIGANRLLVRDGLREIQERQECPGRPQRPRAGIAALCRQAGVAPETLTAEQVSFKLAPRLNAAGRMADPQLALDLLLTDDMPEATRLAAQIEQLNVERRKASHQIVQEAEKILLAQPGWEEQPLLIVRGANWPGGVLGIAANQLVSRFGRPVIVLNDDGEISHGSARSIPGFDIVEALGACEELLVAHGGHSQAAGLTLSSSHVDILADALSHAMERDGFVGVGEAELALDVDLPPERLTLDTARALDVLQPYGAGNEQPLFLVRGLQVRKYDTMGQDRRHLRINFATKRGMIRAVSWGAADRSRELLIQPLIDIAATIGVDTWNGQTRLHVDVKDFRPAV